MRTIRCPFGGQLPLDVFSLTDTDAIHDKHRVGHSILARCTRNSTNRDLAYRKLLLAKIAEASLQS